MPSVEAVQARYGSLPLRERLSGTVRAKNQVEIYPEISGRIEKVYAGNGDKVSQGDVLVELKDTQYREQLRQAQAGLKIDKARLSQAKARLSEVKSRYERISKLAEKEMSSPQELQQVEAEYESAKSDVELAEAQVEQSQANLEERREMLSRTKIKAPVDGSVGNRNAEVGMQISSSDRLYVLGNLDRLKVRVPITENMMRNVEVGQTALIYPGNVDSRDSLVMRAKVSRISPFLNTVSRSSEAQIEVDNTDGLLNPGMFVSVEILYGESENATLIPTSALYTDPNSGDEGVFVVGPLGTEVEPVMQGDNGNTPLTEPLQVQFKSIDVLARGRMQVGIQGVEPGQWVVTVGQNMLSAGDERARIRSVSWQRVMALQGLQPQNLLYQILEEQKQEPS